MSLAEIAYTTGFSSQSHMTTAFTRTLGVTPGALRHQTP
ncbi:helix-turn-helix domain-containing protein [Marinobacter alexandrii]|nr:helix-turn-helix domain-containing protein [Marinobacter alexandrii]